MNNSKKDTLQAKNEQAYRLLRAWHGVKNLANNHLEQVVVLGYLLVAILCVLGLPLVLAEQLLIPQELAVTVLRLTLAVLAGFGLYGIFILFGAPLKCRDVREKLLRIGFTNHNGDIPLLLSDKPVKGTKQQREMAFDSVGLPLSEWQIQKDAIASALNIRVTEIREGKNKREIIVRYVDGRFALAERYNWDSAHRPQKLSELAFGISESGEPVVVDLDKIPHILIGGATGSGKSVLLKCLLAQAVHNGAEVIISDFKGGVDFPGKWQQRTKILTDREAVIACLDSLVREIEQRKQLFRAAGCANLWDYNQQTGASLPRYIFACDELAEMVDKTGLPADEKKQVETISAQLSTIARMGRAFGVNLILATQRPDANLLTGQIRSNIGFRACGRCDSNLSVVVLESADAAKLTVNANPGRFVTKDGTLFQAFWFDDSQL